MLTSVKISTEAAETVVRQFVVPRSLTDPPFMEHTEYAVRSLSLKAVVLICSEWITIGAGLRTDTIGHMRRDAR